MTDAAPGQRLEAGVKAWDHRGILPEDELRQIERGVRRAILRVQIVERALEMHRRSIEEKEERYRLLA